MIKVVKKGIALPFIIFLASVILIIGAFFLLVNKPKTADQITLQTASPSTTGETVHTEASRSVYTDNETANWQTYTSPDNLFSIKYPKDWFLYDWREGKVADDGSYDFSIESRELLGEGDEYGIDDLSLSFHVSPNQKKEGYINDSWNIVQKFPPSKRYVGSETKDDIGQNIKIVRLLTVDGVQGFDVETTYVNPPTYERIIYIPLNDKIIKILQYVMGFDKSEYHTKGKKYNQILSTFKFSN